MTWMRSRSTSSWILVRGGACTSRLNEPPAGECHCTILRSVGRVRVGLFERLGAIERVDFHAFAENTHDRRQACSLDIEKLRPEDLGNQAHVGDRRRIAMAELAGFPFLAQMPFERLERLERPVREPLVARRLVLAHLALEVAADTRNDQRMPVTHGDLCEPPHACPAARI